MGKLLQPGDNEGERETELEHAAMCSEALMEEYLETGELSAENISDTVAERKLFPCFFGFRLETMGNYRAVRRIECVSAPAGISGGIRSPGL